MRVLLLALITASTLFAQSSTASNKFSFKFQLGVADVNEQGERCLTIPNNKLLEGARVWLVSPYKPQSVVKAIVLKKLTNSCSRNPDTSDEDSFYSLKITEGKFDQGSLAIAYINSTSRVTSRNNSVNVDLDGDGRRESFRVCTSNEGLHLSVWSGQPLTGKRQRHWYYYLGYDVEPNCTDRETRD